MVAPYSCDDAKGLLKAAIRDPNPVVVLESELLYNYSFPLSPEAQSPDWIVPIGKAKVEREGTDVTIVTFSRITGVCLEAAAQLAAEGISVEVVNLRTIRPLDVETVVKSVNKTHRCVTVEEGWPQSGVGAEIAALLMECTQICFLFGILFPFPHAHVFFLSDAFDSLDAPMERVTGADVPMPYATSIETLAMVQPHNVVNAVKRVCYPLGNK